MKASSSTWTIGDHGESASSIDVFHRVFPLRAIRSYVEAFVVFLGVRDHLGAREPSESFLRRLRASVVLGTGGASPLTRSMRTSSRHNSLPRSGMEQWLRYANSASRHANTPIPYTRASVGACFPRAEVIHSDAIKRSGLEGEKYLV